MSRNDLFRNLKKSMVQHRMLLSMLLSVLVLSIIVMVAFFLIVNYTYKTKNIEREIGENEAIANQISKELRRGIYEISETSLNIYANPSINNNIVRLHDRAYDNIIEKIYMEQTVADELQVYFNITESIGCIQVYIEDSEDVITIGNFTAWQVSNISREYNEKYRATVMENGGALQICQLDSGYTVCARSLGDFNSAGRGGVKYTLMLVMSDSYIEKIMDKLYYSNYSTGKMIMFLDGNMNIVHSTNTEYENKNLSELSDDDILSGKDRIELDGKEMLCTIDYNSQIKQYIVLCTETSEIDLQGKTFRASLLLILIGIAAALLLFFIVYSNLFIKPIQRLINSVNSIGTDVKNPDLKPVDIGEGGNLSLSFNEAIKRTEAMVKANYQHIINEKNARIAILQLQINPHFIFNALDTINWSVYQGNTEQSELLISSLGKILRYTTYNYDKFVPLIEEISVIKNFINFERQRHNDFKEYILIENDLRDFKIPCLLIQPLVENACKHGLRDKEGGKLFIRARRVGDQVEILVADNGKGVTPEKLKEILAPGYRREDHIGLVNVRERVQTVFGSKAVFSVTSVDGWYFKVRMLLPVNGE